MIDFESSVLRRGVFSGNGRGGRDGAGRRTFCGLAPFSACDRRQPQGVQAFEVVGQAHEVPFAADFLQAAQPKLPEPERGFEDAESLP